MKGKKTVIEKQPDKIFEENDVLFKKGKSKAINELSNKLSSIEQKAGKIYEKVMKKKKIRRRRNKKI